MSTIGHNSQSVSIKSLSDADKKIMKNAILEMNDSLLRQSAERELQKEIVDRMGTELGIDKKIFRRMAKVYYKSNFSQELEDHKNFEEAYEEILHK